MSRIKRVTSWCIIMTTFVAFAAVLLGGMAGMGSAATMSQVASSLSKSEDPSKGSLVVVGADDNNQVGDSVLGSNSNTAVCWVTNRQAAAIRTRWVTTTTRINRRFSLLTVNAPGVAPAVTVTVLRTYVSGGVKCQIVHQRWAFFVPLDGAVS